MDCRKRMLEALNECGEAALFYSGMNILEVNELFAEMFEKTVAECSGMSILSICHNESTEKIRDFIHRRKTGDPNVPIHYQAKFVTPSDPEVTLSLTVLKLRDVKKAVLVIVRK
ncbi:MAG: hypothetical protein GF417_03455 [Candidatus Latescibacteria bacterium]|nr:hypothetical protein [bacterium]MBD3423485.1 hypothetical protein [Candidatus Latescibacterota bacterium]